MSDTESTRLKYEPSSEPLHFLVALQRHPHPLTTVHWTALVRSACEREGTNLKGFNNLHLGNENARTRLWSWLCLSGPIFPVTAISQVVRHGRFRGMALRFRGTLLDSGRVTQHQEQRGLATFSVQGYLAHKKTPTPLGPYCRPLHRVLWGFLVGWAFFCERGTPVRRKRLILPVLGAALPCRCRAMCHGIAKPCRESVRVCQLKKWR